LRIKTFLRSNFFENLKLMWTVGIQTSITYVGFSIARTFQTALYGTKSTTDMAAFGIALMLLDLPWTVVGGYSWIYLSLIARSKNEEERRLFTHASWVFFAFFYVITLIIYQKFAMPIAMFFTAYHEDVAIRVAEYMKLTSWFFFIPFFAYPVAMILRNDNRAYIPMFTSLADNVVDLVVTWLLLKKFEGIVPSAYSIITTFLVVHGPVYFTWALKYNLFKKFRLSLSHLKTFLKLGTPHALEATAGLIAFMIFSKFIGSISEKALAANAIASQITGFAYSLGGGICLGAIAATGKTIGSGNAVRGRIFANLAVASSIAFGIILGLPFMLFPQKIATLFSKDMEVVRLAVPVLKMFGIIFAIDISSYLLSSIIQAGGDTLFSMLVTMSLNYGVWLPLAYFSALHKSFAGCWLALFIAMTAAYMIFRIRIDSMKWVKKLND